MSEDENKPFKPRLAEDFSIKIHELCQECPHDMGITLAVIAEQFYADDKGE